MMKKAKEELKAVFGFDVFRSNQADIVQHVLEKKDTIVLMPTGGGKSICFQIPALLFEGTTLVISPLISLMKDQVEALRANGVSAAYFNSSLTDAERNQIVFKARAGEYKLLYMAPETIMPNLKTWLGELNISLVAIDEAHCVSMWGHDFRPEYTQLEQLRQFWPHVPYVALTATADKATRHEIETKLGLKNPKTFLSSFDRPNLSLNVRGNMKKNRKEDEVLSFIAGRPNQSGIIYCLSRRETEEWSEFLSLNGIHAKHYHAGLSSEDRSKIQEDFITDRVPIITATIAFGMGIDKSNVRWVIHNNLPKNIEGYYQEIGRAGRDGLPSETMLFYNMRDVKLLADFARESEHGEVLLEKLNRMLNYAESQTCRRKTLLSYFSENLPDDCGNCDVCNNPPDFLDGTIIAQMAMSGVMRTEEKIGANMLIQLLRGAKTSELMSKGYHTLKTYGVGAQFSVDEWQHFINQLINLGLIEIAYAENFNLRITDFGRQVLSGESVIKLAEFKKKQLASTAGDVMTTSVNAELFEMLRLLRRQIADSENVPPYVVFSDASLHHMADALPASYAEMKDISGVGNQKLAKYGEIFLTEIAKYTKISTDFGEIPSRARAKRKPSKQKGGTYKITLDLYHEGLRLAEIAEKRGMAQSTVASHLVKLFEDGEAIDLTQFVDKAQINRVFDAVKSTKVTDRLTPIFEALNQEVPYEDIRFSLGILEREGKLSEFAQ